MDNNYKEFLISAFEGIFSSYPSLGYRIVTRPIEGYKMWDDGSGTRYPNYYSDTITFIGKDEDVKAFETGSNLNVNSSERILHGVVGRNSSFIVFFDRTSYNPKYYEGIWDTAESYKNKNFVSLPHSRAVCLLGEEDAVLGTVVDTITEFVSENGITPNQGSIGVSERIALLTKLDGNIKQLGDVKVKGQKAIQGYAGTDGK